MTRVLIVTDVQNDFCPGGALAIVFTQSSDRTPALLQEIVFILDVPGSSAGAVWVNVSTLPPTGSGRPAPTESGYPQNATSRSPCWSFYGTAPGTFPTVPTELSFTDTMPRGR